MGKIKIPISVPHLTTQDFREIKKCFDSTWISSKSPWVGLFESAFAHKVAGTKYASSVNSGTSALFLALLALGVGPGDEVILPALTMIATVNAISLTGAKPVLVDSTSRFNWNIDPEKVQKKINPKTKAIMPVHLYGYACDMDDLREIAKRHGISLIEDAAEAMGSDYKGEAVGSLSDVSCFSLYSNKIITTGNGGIVCTNHKKIYDLVNKLKFFDFNEAVHFKHKIIGYNLVMSGLQAALGYSQVKRFKYHLKKRRKIFAWYKKMVAFENLRFVEADPDSNPNYWFPAVIAKNSGFKKRITAALQANSIEFREFFLPVHRQPVYKNFFTKQEYPVADYFYQRGLLLPSYFNLTLNQVSQISKTIKGSIQN